MAFAVTFVTYATAEDYSVAFDNLRKIGLPDTKGSNYAMLVPVEQQYDNWGRDSFSLFPQLYNVQFSGNSWILSETTDENTFVAVVGGTRISQFSKTAEKNASMAATWKSSDLDSDVKLLKAKFKDSEFRDSLEYEPSIGGAILVFAAHVDRMGGKSDAADLVKQCLDAMPTPEIAIQSAIELVANGKYEIARKEAYRSGDWSNFAAECRELADTLGTGWTGSQAVLILAERADEQPEVPPPLTAPSGVNLSEADHALASKFAKLQTSKFLDRFRHVGPWVFAKRAGFERYGPLSSPKEQDVLDTLLERKKEVIPALLAMLDDKTLLPFDRSSSQVISDELDQTLEESGNENSSMFPRPSTRADIAAALLLPLVPNIDTYETGMNEFRDISLSWWKRVKDMSEIELAREYLRTPDRESFGPVAEYLATHGNEEDFATIEELLAAKLFSSTWPNYSEARAYVQARGNDAKPFIDTIEEKVEKTAEQLASAENPELEQFKKRHEDNLKMLRSLISNESLEDILLRIASGEEDINSQRQILASKAQTTSPQESIEAFVRAADAATDPTARSQLLAWSGYFIRNDNSAKLELTRKEEWKRLLADDRNPQGNTPISATAAWIVESLYDAESVAELTQFRRMTGRAGSDLILSRAKARVEGGDIPPFPKASDVSEERASEIRAEILSLSENRGELRAKLSDLSLAERFLVIGEPPSQQPTGIGASQGEGVKEKPKDEVALAIESVQFEISEVKVEGQWQGELPTIGETFTTDIFDSLLNDGLDSVSEDGTFSLRIEQESPFGPVQILIGTPSRDELLAEEAVAASFSGFSQMISEPIPIVAASFGNQRFQAFWFPEEEEKKESPQPRPASSGYDFRSYMKDSGEEARKGLPAWLSAPAAYARPLDIRMIGFTQEPPKEDE
ncbi:MAG: hypothetical protein CMO55_19670 [Verrucomicrobiales bacterium]|nr:hypothetical protein [Verrucomicrobiales bacterium]